MSILNCYLCEQTFFDLPEAVKHLKIIHLVKENVDEIICVVRNENNSMKCSRTFQTFRGMCAHAKKCVPKTHNYSKADEVSEQVYKNDIFCHHIFIYPLSFTYESFNLNLQPVTSTDELCHTSLNEYRYDPTENSDLESNQLKASDDDVYLYEESSITDPMSQFLNEYSNKIKSMFLTNEKTEQIFNLSIRLIEEYTHLCCDLLNGDYNVDKNKNKSTLQMASDYVRNKLTENNSSFKRHLKLVKSGLFVAPQEKALGTHWEMIRKKSTNAAVPRLLQSISH